ncbi:MAG: DNA primase [Planctomycetota bacterium]|nr:DNA primase [Planctomycetota bacterium]
MSGIPATDELERIRDANPIEDVVPEYVELIRRGNVFKGLCPFHPDQNPSMDVNPARQTFRCWSCEEHGDVFTFIQKIEGIDFPEAKQKLADRAGIEIQQFHRDPRREEQDQQDYDLLERAANWFQRQLQSEKGIAAREYLAGRGFTDETIQKFRIGFAPDGWSHLDDDLALLGSDSMRIRQRACELGLLKEKSEGGRYYDAYRDRVIFPILDHRRGRVIGFGGRHLGSSPDPSGGPPPKYINSPESRVFSKKHVLYGGREGRLEIGRQRRVILCEGYTDVMMAHQSGFATAVATLGTAFTDEHVALLKKLVHSVDLILDGDEAGQAAARRACERFMGTGLGVRVVILDEGVDPCELLHQEQGPHHFEQLLEKGEDPIAFIVQQILVENPGKGASAAQQVLEQVSRVVLEPFEGQSVALESAARIVGGVTGLGELTILADHHRLLQQRGPRRALGARRTGSSVATTEVVGEPLERPTRGLPDLEEAILVSILRDPQQAALLLRLRPPVQWSNRWLRSLAIRIEQLKEIPDPVHLQDEAEKSIFLGLLERVAAEQEYTPVDERVELQFNLAIDLVVDHLKGMIGRIGEVKLDLKTKIDINKTIQSLKQDRESHHNLSLLGEIINKFEGGED